MTFKICKQYKFQRAMDIYQQEFSRLQQNALAAALRAHQNDGDIPGFAASISSRDDGVGRDNNDDNDDNNDQLDKPSSPDGSDRSGPNSPSDCGQDSPIGNFLPVLADYYESDIHILWRVNTKFAAL